MDKEDISLCNKLVSLQERKRKLEEEIKMVNVEIANSTKEIDRVGKKKTELYQKGRELKAKRDDLMINVPRLKAEQDLANKTRDNIEVEWFKLQQQFMLLVARVAS
jgi:seryl-tRNA synthetase